MSSGSPATALRRMCIADLDMVLSWRNHIDVRRYMYTQHLISREEHRSWFNRAVNDGARSLLVFERDGQPSGFVNITIVDTQARRAEWGFYLAHDALPGSGGLLGRQALKYAFDELQLHKVCGEALVYNERSIRFHKRLGFLEEGRLRHHYYDGEQYNDIVVLGLLVGEWRNNGVRTND